MENSRQLVDSSSAKNMEVEEKLALFRAGLAAFKQEREAALLDLTKSRVPRASNSIVGGGVAAPFLGNKVLKSDLSRVLDTDIILVVHQDAGSEAGRDKWPCALVANFARSVAELGFMESNGSLWRIVKRDLSSSASQDGLLKVVLRTAEIGEKELFLSSELELVKDIQEAAVWFARVVVTPSSLVGTLQLQAAVSSTQGLLVQLELLGSDGDSNEIEPKLLVTASSNTGEGGVAILTEKQRLLDTTFRWNLVWEVMREDTFVDGLDDLANELEQA